MKYLIAALSCVLFVLAGCRPYITDIKMIDVNGACEYKYKKCRECFEYSFTAKCGEYHVGQYIK